MTEELLKDALRLCEDSKAYKDGAIWAVQTVAALKDALFELHLKNRKRGLNVGLFK
jgi:hypothetical protein